MGPTEARSGEARVGRCAGRRRTSRPGRGGADPSHRRGARGLAATHGPPVLAVPRRRPGRLPADARDLHGARRPARSGVGGGLAARRRQARGTGDPPIPAALRHLIGGGLRQLRVDLHPDSRRAGGVVRSRRPRGRGAAAPQAAGAARTVAEGAGSQLQRDQRADRVVVHEGQPLPHRGPPQLPRALRDDRVGRRMRTLVARHLGDGRRRGDAGAAHGAAAAPAQLPGLPSDAEGPAGQHRTPVGGPAGPIGGSDRGERRPPHEPDHACLRDRRRRLPRARDPLVHEGAGLHRGGLGGEGGGGCRQRRSCGRRQLRHRGAQGAAARARQAGQGGGGAAAYASGPRRCGSGRQPATFGSRTQSHSGAEAPAPRVRHAGAQVKSAFSGVRRDRSAGHAVHASCRVRIAAAIPARKHGQSWSQGAGVRWRRVLLPSSEDEHGRCVRNDSRGAP